MLTDLSKALNFDYLPRQLLIAKFKSACELMCSYFFQRQQCMKIGDSRSEWKHVTQGTAQGSIVGPFAFNVLANDLLLKIY